MINRHRCWVLNHTVISICFIENGDKVPRSLCTRFIFILVNALARCSLGHDHRSTIDLWLDVCLFRSCSCSRTLTAANCHYALWHQISHVHVTLLWWECFYGAIWSWILLLILLLPSLFTKTRASSPQILLWQNIVLKQINIHYGIAQGDVVDTHEHT